MEIGLTDSEKKLPSSTNEKLSTRSSMFAWLICALLGWALAFTSFYTLTGDETDTKGNQHDVFAKEAMQLEQVAPAAGKIN